MLACARCGTELPPGAVFCDACGAHTAPQTPDVGLVPQTGGLEEAIGRLIPTEYAERLLATQGRATPERRLLTMLFADVKGSTALAEKLDPEDVLEVMNGAFEVLIGPVVRYEGTLARLMGDAVLAFFGAPIAHEDDAERAARAGLEIVASARAYAAWLAAGWGLEGFDVRVGIHTGEVVVGEVGTDLRVEYTAMGDAVNLAARMEQAAAPGTVLVTEETYRLVEPLFEVERVGPLVVKGKTEPVVAYRVVAARAEAGKLRGVPGLVSPLVGRVAERAALEEALERVGAGVGGIVTVVGEAGLGKSRLVAEAQCGSLVGADRDSPAPSALHHRGGRNAVTAPLQWVEGRCLSYGTSIAYLLWVDVLRGLLDVTVEDAPGVVADRLAERVRALCAERYDAVYPYLASLLSLPLDAESEDTLANLDGEQRKARMFSALEALLEGATAAQPLVVVCEDLHWADPTSLELLERVLGLTDRAGLLLVCVFRPEREHGSWRVREVAARDYPHRLTDLRLRPLTETESGQLVRNLVEGLGDAFGQLRARILSLAEGNPFYVEEVLRSLIDDGAIAYDEVSDAWTAQGDIADIALPETLQGVLVARIDRLAETPKRVLRIASVVGRVFPLRVLAAIVPNERRLAGHLQALQGAQLIRERARIPELEYIFKHELTREAAYAGLLKRERRGFHRQVAEALEGLYPERAEEQAGLLAHHWERAGDPERAVGYLQRAGDGARQVGASLEAASFYRAALHTARELGAPRRSAEEQRIHERLGDVYLENLSRHDLALEHYSALLALAQSDEGEARAARKVASAHLLRGDLTEAGRCYERALARLAHLPPLAEGSRAHYGLAYLLALKGQWDEAAGHARAALDISRQVDDVRGLADAYRVLSGIAKQRGDLEAACEYDESCLELYQQLGDLPRTAQACNNVGDTYRLLGRMDCALERLDEGLAIARRIGDARDEAVLLQTQAEVLLDRGEWQAGIARLARALALAEESGAVARQIEVRSILGAACIEVGLLEKARLHLEAAETQGRERQLPRFAPRVHLELARLYAAQGRLCEAEEAIQLALNLAGPEPSNVFLGLARRCQGYLCSCREDWNGALAYTARALDTLEQTHLAAEIGKVHLDLGAAFAHRGQVGDGGRAREHLLAARSFFQKIQAHGYFARVEAALTQNEGRRFEHPDARPARDR